MNVGALFHGARKIGAEAGSDVLGAMRRAVGREGLGTMEKAATVAGYGAGAVGSFYGKHWSGAMGGSFLSGAVIGGTAGAASGFVLPSEGRGRFETAFRRGITGGILGGAGSWGYTKLAANKAVS